ncbi:Deoxyribodipyrimidine photo-lyase [compost metagenome]
MKHLLIPWTEGASWFRQTLVDADTANNAMGWQWVTGSGFDAAPYFRIFNPAAQGRRFDPEGSYIRRWVPELRRLPDALIHEPWKAAPGVLDQCGLAPDSPYRKPVVDHAFARERALEAYRIMNLH